MKDHEINNAIFDKTQSEREAVIEAFEEAWNGDSVPDLDAFIEDVGDVTLIELVHVDLENRIKAGVPRAIEHYLQTYPELAIGEVAIELIAAEYKLRKRSDLTVHPVDYQNRFPRWSEEIVSRFKVIDDQELNLNRAEQETVAVTQDALQTDQNLLSTVAKESLPAIPGYEVLALVAAGGMGIVFKARDESLGRLVAIKLPRQELSDDAEGQERFLREARASAKLRHANICPIHEIGQIDGKPYIVMGFVEGQTLHDTKKQGITARDAVNIVAKTALAVDYAHGHGIIHRDIKPANILIDHGSGDPILTDFGLAKELSPADPQVTKSGQVMGTPAFMSPEQATGHHQSIGTRTDVYALGAVLYDLLVGQPPFTGSVASILGKLSHETAASPRRLVPSLHRDLETICMKALARDPQDRYETAASLADDLLRFADGRAILARPDGPTKKAWRGIRKRPWTSVIAAVSLCAFSVILASFLTVRHKTQRISELRNAFAGQLRDLEFAPIEIAHDKVTQLSALVGRLDAISPAEAARASDSIDRELTRYVQTNAASSVLEDADIPRLRELVSMIGGKRSVDAGHLNTLLDSAQRGWIPSLQLDGSIERLEDALPATLFTRQGERLLRSKENTGSGTAFSALATTTVPSVGDCRLQATFSVPVDLQRPVGMSIDTVEYQEGAFSNIAFSPDGRWLAASSWGAVRVWDVENRSIVCEFGGKHRIVNMEFSVDGACLFLPDHSNHVRVYSLPEGREIGSFTTASDLFHVSPSRDQFVTVEGAMFVLHSIVGTELIPLRQFDIRADQADLVTKPSEIGHLAFADDARIVTIDNSGIVSLWNTQTGSRIDSFESSVTEATAVAVSGSANMIAIGTPNDGVVVWDWGKGQHHRLSHGGRIQLLRFTGKGTDPLLSSASAYKACIWNLTDYQRVHERIVDLTMWGNRTWISHGDQITIASGLEIERWNTREGAVQLLSSRPHDVRAFALHEGTRTMATADSDRVIHLLDLETARDLGQLGGSQYSVQVTPMSAGLFNLSLLRHGAVVGESHVKLPIQDELYSLTLVAERLQGRLRVWVNGEPDTDTPNLVFDDLWKSTNGNLGKFGLYVPETSSVANVRSYSRKDADFRTLWHFANEAFAGGNYRLAASQFASEAARLSATIDPHANEQTQEANYKHAVSLLQSANEDPTRRDTAKDIFNRLQQESGERWPIYAKTQLFGMELLSGNDSEAQRIIAEFEEREVNFRQIAVVLPEQVRAKVLQESRRQFGSFNSWYSYAPDRSRKLRLARFIETMISGVPSAVSTLKLMRAYMLEDNLVAATQLADEEIARGVTNAELAQDVAWVLRVNRRYGESHRFLDALLEKSQIDGNDWAHRLLIDKSMTLASEERFDEALAVLGDVLANASRAKVDEQSDVPRVQLIRGFVLQDLGRAAEAAQAWSEGFRSLPMVGNEHRINNHADAIYCWLLAGLSNEVQGDELNQIVSQLAERFGSQHAIVTTVNMLGRDRIGRAMMECINTPRGYRIARDVAYQNQSLADLVSDLPVLLASFIIAKQIAPEGMSPKQDELLWKLGKAYFKSIFQDGQLSFSQLGVIGGAWQLVRGTGFAELAATTAWGSADVTLQKHPQLHGPSAYFFGLRTNSNSIKQMCFQRALSCANDNQTLRELVQAEIEAE